jgi:hypothetical protein
MFAGIGRSFSSAVVITLNLNTRLTHTRSAKNSEIRTPLMTRRTVPRMNLCWILCIDANSCWVRASTSFRLSTPAIFALLALTPELRRKRVQQTVTVAKNNRV